MIAVRLYNAPFYEMWRCFVGKICVLDSDHLKEAIPMNKREFRNRSVKLVNRKIELAGIMGDTHG